MEGDGERKAEEGEEGYNQDVKWIYKFKRKKSTIAMTQLKDGIPQAVHLWLCDLSALSLPSMRGLTQPPVLVL